MYDFEGARNIIYIAAARVRVRAGLRRHRNFFKVARTLGEFLRWTCVVALPARALSCWQEEKDCKALVRLRRKKDNRPLISGSKFQGEASVLSYPCVPRAMTVTLVIFYFARLSGRVRKPSLLVLACEKLRHRNG